MYIIWEYLHISLTYCAFVILEKTFLCLTLKFYPHPVVDVMFEQTQTCIRRSFRYFDRLYTCGSGEECKTLPILTIDKKKLIRKPSEEVADIKFCYFLICGWLFLRVTTCNYHDSIFNERGNLFISWDKNIFHVYGFIQKYVQKEVQGTTSVIWRHNHGSITMDYGANWINNVTICQFIF